MRYALVALGVALAFFVGVAIGGVAGVAVVSARAPKVEVVTVTATVTVTPASTATQIAGDEEAEDGPDAGAPPFRGGTAERDDDAFDAHGGSPDDGSPVGSVDGRVLVAGKGVGDVQVEACPYASSWSASFAKTEVDGTFHLEHVRAGDAEIVIESATLGRASAKVVVPANATRSGVELVPEKRGISGTVVGPDGRPLADADVSISNDFGDDVPHCTFFHQAKTGDDGAFSRLDLPYDTATIEVRATGLRTIEKKHVPVPSDQVRIALSRGATLHGTVAGATVSTGNLSSKTETRSIGFNVAGGEFTAANVDPGDWIVNVDGFEPISVSLTDGETTNVVLKPKK